MTKDVEWAARAKRTRLPVGSKCLKCVQMVRSCFSAYSWDQCVLLKSTSPDFAEKMQQATRSFDPKKMAHPGFVPEDVQEGEQMGYRVEMPHKFISEQSLLDKSGLSAKELAKAIHIDEFADHRGEKQRGVLLPHGDMVVICYRDYHSSLSAAHHSSRLQVRKEQGQDVYEWLKKSLASERKMPAPMSKSKVLQSEEELQKFIDTAVESKRSVINQAEVQSQLQPSPDEPQVQQAEEDLEDEIEFAEGADALGPALDSAKGKGKNKGKQAGRGGGSRKQQTTRGAGRGKAALSKAKARVSSRASAPSLAGASSLPPGDGSSARSSTSTGGNDEEGPAHWINDLSISNMLSGRSEKLNYHYANKALGGLQKAENGNRSSNIAAPTQLLLLKSHLELYRAAEKLLPGSIKKLTKDTRRETLQQLHVHGHEIPPFTRGSVLLQVCLETESVEEQVGMLVPVAEGDQNKESWDSDHPSMATPGLSTLEQGKLIQRLLFEETLLRFLMDSDDGKLKCKLWAKAVLDKMKPVAEQDNVDFSPVLKQAIDDLVTVAQLLLILLQASDLVSGSPDAMSAVLRVTNCKSGIKSAVKQVQAWDHDASMSLQRENVRVCVCVCPGAPL